MNIPTERILDLQNLYFSMLTNTYKQKIDVWLQFTNAVRIKNGIDLSSVPESKLYVWSDQHFSHQNIIKYCNRPFDDIAQMNQYMIDSYKQKIGVDGVCIWVGDVAFGSLEIIHTISQLPGYKILILGNHDLRKGRLNYQLAFNEIHPIVQMDNVIFSHYPFNAQLPSGYINVHGHIHDLKSDSPNHACACVEHTNYEPVLLCDLIRDHLT